MARYVRIDGFPETPEDVFGMTIKGLLAQGVPSVLDPLFPVIPEPRCMYRSIRGGVQVACGAGLWIPDKVYRFDMEGLPFRTLANYLGDKWRRPFLSASMGYMQRIHDTAAKEWVGRGGEENDWAPILKVGAENIIDKMTTIERNMIVPTNWREFFNPE